MRIFMLPRILVYDKKPSQILTIRLGFGGGECFSMIGFCDSDYPATAVDDSVLVDVWLKITISTDRVQPSECQAVETGGARLFAPSYDAKPFCAATFFN